MESCSQSGTCRLANSLTLVYNAFLHPIGGILTVELLAKKNLFAESAMLFVSCEAPFVFPGLLDHLLLTPPLIYWSWFCSTLVFLIISSCHLLNGTESLGAADKFKQASYKVKYVWIYGKFSRKKMLVCWLSKGRMAGFYLYQVQQMQRPHCYTVLFHSASVCLWILVACLDRGHKVLRSWAAKPKRIIDRYFLDLKWICYQHFDLRSVLLWHSYPSDNVRSKDHVHCYFPQSLSTLPSMG